MGLKSNNYGYLFIFTSYDGSIKNVNLVNLFSYKVFLEEETECSKKYINNQRFDLLNKKSEGYLFYKSIILRFALLMMTKQELSSIKK